MRVALDEDLRRYPISKQGIHETRIMNQQNPKNPQGNPGQNQPRPNNPSQPNNPAQQTNRPGTGGGQQGGGQRSGGQEGGQQPQRDRGNTGGSENRPGQGGQTNQPGGGNRSQGDEGGGSGTKDPRQPRYGDMEPNAPRSPEPEAGESDKEETDEE